MRKSQNSEKRDGNDEKQPGDGNDIMLSLVTAHETFPCELLYEISNSICSIKAMKKISYQCCNLPNP